MNVGLFGHPFPSTVRGAVKAAHINTAIEKHIYAVCPDDACNAIYKANSSPTHCTQSLYGKVCGKSLGYIANMSHGRKKWKPHKNFEFIPPSSSLRRLFRSKKFNELLDSSNSYPQGTISDIQHGRVWEQFAKSGYFSTKYNVGLMMNIDWLRPFKRGEHKLAGIQLTVLNLPREHRSKKRWTILAGIIINHNKVIIINPRHNNYLFTGVVELRIAIPINKFYYT